MLAPLLLIFLAADAQPTVFLDHQLGESVGQWLSKSHIDLAGICGSHKRSDKQMDYKSVCRQLTALRNGADDHFQFTDESGRTIDWHFSKGSLVDATMIQPLGSTLEGSADAQIRLLTEVYGPATHRETVKNHDAFGQTWDTEKAEWEMPDGSLIQSVERIEINTITRDAQRSLYVTGLSRDAAKSQREKLNPYAPRH